MTAYSANFVRLCYARRYNSCSLSIAVRLYSLSYPGCWSLSQQAVTDLNTTSALAVNGNTCLSRRVDLNQNGSRTGCLMPKLHSFYRRRRPLVRNTQASFSFIKIMHLAIFLSVQFSNMQQSENLAAPNATTQAKCRICRTFMINMMMRQSTFVEVSSNPQEGVDVRQDIPWDVRSADRDQLPRGRHIKNSEFAFRAFHKSEGPQCGHSGSTSLEKHEQRRCRCRTHDPCLSGEARVRLSAWPMQIWVLDNEV